jgi:hypothetical protein
MLWLTGLPNSLLVIHPDRDGRWVIKYSAVFDVVDRKPTETGVMKGEALRSPLGDLVSAVILTLFSPIICRSLTERAPGEDGQRLSGRLKQIESRRYS